MKLYEIDAAIEQTLESAVNPETGEISSEAFAELLDLRDKREDKCEAIALAYKNASAEAAAIKAEAQALTARQRTAERRADSLRQYLAFALQGEKLRTPRVSVSYRRTSSVDVPDVNALMKKYRRYSDPVPDKAAIKAAIEAGQKVRGASIVERQAIIVK